MTQHPAPSQIVLAARPKGRPQLTDFRLETMTLPDIRDGQVLLAVQYLSLDPYMRLRMDDRKSYAAPTAIGAPMEGESIARVIASRNPGFKEGDLVLSYTGWCTHRISSGKHLTRLDQHVDPVTTALGVLGMPGFTAYAGLRNIGKPQAGETVVVAAATGPVGSMVGQIAKIKGARAVGIAGGPKKCSQLLEKFGFDAAIDHRAPDFTEQLAQACPDGVDVYFENVGGAVWQAVLPLLNDHARIPVCGLVAQYNGAQTGSDSLAATMGEILSRSLTLRGFIQHEFASQRSDFLAEASEWIKEGRIRFQEDIVSGFENAPQAFIGLLEGRNFGKLIIEVAAGEL